MTPSFSASRLTFQTAARRLPFSIADAHLCGPGLQEKADKELRVRQATSRLLIFNYQVPTWVVQVGDAWTTLCICCEDVSACQPLRFRCLPKCAAVIDSLLDPVALQLNHHCCRRTAWWKLR